MRPCCDTPGNRKEPEDVSGELLGKRRSNKVSEQGSMVGHWESRAAVTSSALVTWSSVTDPNQRRHRLPHHTLLLVSLSGVGAGRTNKLPDALTLTSPFQSF